MQRTKGGKALRIPPSIAATGYAALGGYERLVANDLQRSAEQYEKGRRLAPGEPRFLFATALVEEGLGRWEASVDHLREAERLNPRSVPNKRVLGFAPEDVVGKSPQGSVAQAEAGGDSRGRAPPVSGNRL